MLPCTVHTVVLRLNFTFTVSYVTDHLPQKTKTRVAVESRK